AIVHVWRRVDHLPQRRCLELPLVGLVAGYSPATRILRTVVHDADVVKVAVGEVRALVTQKAAGLTVEELHAPELPRRKSLFFSLQVAIERSIAHDDRSL